MKAYLRGLFPVLLAGLVLAGCSRDAVHVAGELGVNAVVMSAVSPESAPLHACPGGGIIIKSGHDRNWNHVLDPGEVELVLNVCNGMNGAGNTTGGVPALIKMVPEPAGANCAAGGQKILAGPDNNRNGVLDASEVTSTGFVCNGLNGTNGTNGTNGSNGSNGSNGTNGTNGTNGANSLISVVPEPAGPNCAGGGLKVVSWLDTVANGVLDPSETAFTNFVCAGPGTVTIESISADPVVVRPGQTTAMLASATDGMGSTLTYSWSGPGSFAAPSSAGTVWTAPATVGSYLLQVQVSNGPSTVTGFASILVSAAPSGPVVTSVSPTQSRVGQEVVITGAGFGAAQDAGTVSIGGVDATSITSWSDVQIRAIVPSGATTGSVIVTVGGAPSSPGFIALLWASADNVAVSTAGGGQLNPQLVADGSGGAIIVWEDNRSLVAGFGTDVYAQRVNSAGVAQWAVNGVPVATAAADQVGPKIVADGSGGAIIAWTDARNGASNTDIFAQRLNAAGVPQWAENGVPVSAAASFQSAVQLVTDGSGGAILAWEDRRNGVSNSDIYAQRISGAGGALWVANGVPVSTASDDQISPRLVSDGSGGAIIVWTDMRNMATTGIDVYAQRVDSAGAPQWDTNGVAVTSDANQFNPQVVPDGAGGAIIAWEDDRNLFSDVFAQRLDSAGTPLWDFGGVAVSTADGNQSAPQLIPDGGGGAIIAWQDFRTGFVADIYAQRVSSRGMPLWTANGAAVSAAPGDQINQQLVADGSGGAIVVWEDNRSGSLYHVFAQRIDRAGVPHWPQDGIAISMTENQALSGQLLPQLVSDGSGGAIITWTDDRNNATTSTDIYAQGVTADGTQ
ncbi:MAG TPA: IPT/TIG domain-containing protein [Burkholderiales bacterium]|nr:IPT/TIG domain-containing protein [Burkholderiales bacterium]